MKVTDATLAFVSHHENSTSESRDFGHHEQVSAVRADDLKRRSTDASTLTFPLQLVIGVATIAVTVYGSVWAANSRNEAANAAMRQDIAIIRQMQADQSKVDDYKAKLEEERSGAITRAIAELKARTEMTDLKVNNLRETVLTSQRR